MPRRELTIAELEEQDRREQAHRAKQAECGHHDCHPSEWYWSGQVREMKCDNCGLTEFREEA